MSNIKDGSIYFRSQEMDLEATALIDRPSRQKTLSERITAYGYKRIAFDALIFIIKLAVLIGLAELINYGSYKKLDKISNITMILSIYFGSIYDEILRCAFQMRLYLEFCWRGLQMQYS